MRVWQAELLISPGISHRVVSLLFNDVYEEFNASIFRVCNHSNLNIVEVCFFITSVNFYQITLRHIPEVAVMKIPSTHLMRQ
jgi:hypothetical protein